MVLFFVVNTFLFILLATQCCGMSAAKRQNVTRRFEKLFGIPERPSINLEVEEEKVGQEKEKEEQTEEERSRQIEESRKIIAAIKDELEKKMD